MALKRQMKKPEEESEAAVAFREPAGLTRIGNPEGADHLDLYVARQVLANMAGMVRKNRAPCVVGLLMGKIFTGGDGRASVMAMKLIPFKPDREGRLPRSISEKTWKKLEHSIKQRSPGADIVGVFVSRPRDENHGLENDLDRSARLINAPHRIAAFLDPASLDLHIFAKSGQTVYTLSAISIFEDEKAMMDFSKIAVNGKARGENDTDHGAAVNRGRAFIAVAVLISAALCVLALHLTLQLRQLGFDERELLENTRVQIESLSAHNQSAAEHERLVARADALQKQNQERQETIARMAAELEQNQQNLEQAQADLQTGEEILSGHRDFFTFLGAKTEEMESAVEKLKSAAGKDKEIMAAAALMEEQLSEVRHELEKARGQGVAQNEPEHAPAMAAGEATGTPDNGPESSGVNPSGDLKPAYGNTVAKP